MKFLFVLAQLGVAAVHE